MNTKIRSLKKVCWWDPQRNFGYDFQRIWPVYQNEFDMPAVVYKLFEKKTIKIGATVFKIFPFLLFLKPVLSH